MSTKRPGGRLITFEGGEGAGKSTQLPLLAASLRKAGVKVITTREPGGTGSGEAIRTLLVTGSADRWRKMTEALLHYAQRVEHVEQLIAPAMARGAWVLCDRFADSTMAYQGFGHRLGRDRIAALHQLALGSLQPDLTFILDLPVEIGLERASARHGGEDRYERMDVDFHRRLRAGFRDIAKHDKRRCVLLDATRAPEEIAAQIRETVAKRFELRLD